MIDMKKATSEMIEMHNFFEKYNVPLGERIEILKILRSGDELLVALPLQKKFENDKEEYVYLLWDKLGPIDFVFEKD